MHPVEGKTGEKRGFLRLTTHVNPLVGRNEETHAKIIPFPHIWSSPSEEKGEKEKEDRMREPSFSIPCLVPRIPGIESCEETWKFVPKPIIRPLVCRILLCIWTRGLNAWTSEQRTDWKDNMATNCMLLLILCRTSGGVSDGST